MKLTKKQLNRIIKEELVSLMEAEIVGAEVAAGDIRGLRGNMGPLSKEELQGLLPSGDIADPMNPRGALQHQLMPLGKKDGVAYYKPMDGSWMQVPMESSGEFATAGGMEQMAPCAQTAVILSKVIMET